MIRTRVSEGARPSRSSTRARAMVAVLAVSTVALVAGCTATPNPLPSPASPPVSGTTERGVPGVPSWHSADSVYGCSVSGSTIWAQVENPPAPVGGVDDVGVVVYEGYVATNAYAAGAPGVLGSIGVDASDLPFEGDVVVVDAGQCFTVIVWVSGGSSEGFAKEFPFTLNW